jgi:hypothetical protein
VKLIKLMKRKEKKEQPFEMVGRKTKKGETDKNRNKEKEEKDSLKIHTYQISKTESEVMVGINLF